uniref:Acyl-CoA synthetase short-chain family member 3, mitochondrial n=1 Tax=Astyanax mexicanus TaxID=7994 RepID=A0A3B1JHP0_ASTMX
VASTRGDQSRAGTNSTNYATACLCVRPLQDCRSRDWGQFGVTVRDGGRWTRAGDRRWGSSGAARAQVYEGAFRGARDEPERFWGEAARGVSWFTSWEKTLDCSHPAFPRWFVGGELNMCYNAVDRHVESGRGEQPAIIHDSPVTGSKQIFTYREVQDEVSRLAGVLVKHGVRKGDLVVIYMPMVPQAMFTMLACARIGAPHSLIFGGFASKELSVRIDHAKPKLLVTASFGVEPGQRVEYIPLVEKALELSSHKPHKVLIYNRPGMVRPCLGLDWDEEMATARPQDCVGVPSDHPLYVLYTSGTTGTPKGVVRDTGGYAVILNWTMNSVYGLNPGEVWWAASDLGWVVGHSYICYAPLLHGNTTVLYEVCVCVCAQGCPNFFCWGPEGKIYLKSLCNKTNNETYHFKYYIFPDYFIYTPFYLTILSSLSLTVLCKLRFFKLMFNFMMSLNIKLLNYGNF